MLLKCSSSRRLIFSCFITNVGCGSLAIAVLMRGSENGKGGDAMSKCIRVSLNKDAEGRDEVYF